MFQTSFFFFFLFSFFFFFARLVCENDLSEVGPLPLAAPKATQKRTMRLKSPPQNYPHYYHLYSRRKGEICALCLVGLHTELRHHSSMTEKSR